MTECKHCFHMFTIALSDELCCMCGEKYDRWINLPE
jgi:rRNA maturation endonuclease Nob1